MKTNSVLREGLMIALLLAPFVYLGLIWDQLPAQIVTNYDLRGNPRDSMDKATSLIVVGVLSIGLYLLLRFLPNLDPKGWLQTSNYQKLRLVVTGSVAVLMGWMWYMAGHQGDAKIDQSILFAVVGLLFAGMGNYMTTLKPNYFVGIRTPWTLQSDVVWRRTHQLGGRLMVAGGLVTAVLALVLPASYAGSIALGILLAVSLLSVAYSYIYFQQEKQQLN